MRVRNPVLRGFHPDPTVCRVGDRYVCATSTFGWCPGLPIHVSEDLAHWRLAGHAMATVPDLERLAVDDGLYAPGLRHDGERYILACTVVDRREQRFRNFITTAADPAGPWSDPVMLPDGIGRIDPTPFLDDDGRLYLLLNDLPPAASECGGSRVIVLWELDRRTFQPIGGRRILWDGAMKRAATPEGPRLYRRDGWYWLLIAEGGTGQGHAVTMARARTLDGPWEPCPSNPLLTHRHLGQQARLQCVGHADLVQSADGSWWALALATRPRGGCALMNRETVLVPVAWEPGAWPVFAPGRGRVSLLTPAPPAAPIADGVVEPWLGLRGPAPIAPCPEGWRLDARPTPLSAGIGRPGLAGRRIVAWTGAIAAEVAAEAGVAAGLALFSNESSFVSLMVRDGATVLQTADGSVSAQAAAARRLELRWTSDGIIALADGVALPAAIPIAAAARGCFTGAVAALVAIGAGSARFTGLRGSGFDA